MGDRFVPGRPGLCDRRDHGYLATDPSRRALQPLGRGARYFANPARIREAGSTVTSAAALCTPMGRDRHTVRTGLADAISETRRRPSSSSGKLLNGRHRQSVHGSVTSTDAL